MNRTLDELWRRYDKACVPKVYSQLERHEAEVLFKNGIGAILYQLANIDPAARERMIFDMLEEHSQYVADRVAQRFDKLKENRN